MSTDRSVGFLSAAKRQFSYWYTQYELIMCINMFEPWEKKLLNTLIIGCALMVGYSSYVYLPTYLQTLFQKTLLFMKQLKYNR